MKAPWERSDSEREKGQVLVLFVLMLTVLLGFMALVIDVGLAYMERRSLQNAVDAAALAAAVDLLNGESLDTAVASTLDYLERNGYDIDDDFTFEANIPPQSGPYQGLSNYVEVLAFTDAPFALLKLFRDDPYAVGARAVAEWRGGGGGGSTPPGPVSVPESVECGTPTVDGRVTDSDGYTQIGNLVGDSIDFGDAFFACDGTFFYFALRLNGPSAGGAVANENMYGPRAKKNGPPGYHEVYQTGWKKHDFKALLSSDRARFQTACFDGVEDDFVVVHDFIQDYLREDGAGWASDTAGNGEVLVAGPAMSASSLEWNLEHPVGTGWGDDPGEEPFVPGDDKAGQSPPFDPQYPTYDSEYDGWVWEMIYEFNLPMVDYDDCIGPILFGLQNFAGEAGALEGIHSSPPKVSGGITLLTAPTTVRLVE